MRLNFNFLGHHFLLKIDLVSWLVQRLFHFLECLDGQVLHSCLVVFTIESVYNVEEVLGEVFGQRESFVELFPHVNVVVFLEIKFDVHVQVQQLFDFHFIRRRSRIFGNPEVLHPNIDIRKLIVVSLVKVAQLDPLVDQP